MENIIDHPISKTKALKPLQDGSGLHNKCRFAWQ